jgi:hypothetical protein
MNNPISILEIGVAHGDTAKLLYDNFNNEKTNFYFFDTFEGLPEPTENDTIYKNIKGCLNFDLNTVKKCRFIR